MNKKLQKELKDIYEGIWIGHYSKKQAVKKLTTLFTKHLSDFGKKIKEIKPINDPSEEFERGEDFMHKEITECIDKYMKGVK